VLAFSSRTPNFARLFAWCGTLTQELLTVPVAARAPNTVNPVVSETPPWSGRHCHSVTARDGRPATCPAISLSSAAVSICGWSRADVAHSIATCPSVVLARCRVSHAAARLPR